MEKENPLEEFTYNEWKERQEKLNEEINNDNPIHGAIANLAYGIRLNHQIIEEVKESVEGIEDTVENKGITRKDVKLWVMIVSSILVPLVPILLTLL